MRNNELMLALAINQPDGAAQGSTGSGGPD